jgi:primosomal protein N' (replication factor Y)
VQVDAAGLNQPFTYSIPDGIKLTVGDAVLAPFGSRSEVGYVIKISRECSPDILHKIKPVTARIANAAAFDEELVELAKWVAGENLCDLKDTIKLIAPEIMAARLQSTLFLVENWEEMLAATRSQAQRDAAAALAGLGGKSSLSALTKAMAPTGMAAPKVAAIVSDLKRKGAVAEERTIGTPKAKTKIVRVLTLCADVEVVVEEIERMERRNAARQSALLRALLNSMDNASAAPTVGIAIAPGAHAAAQALAEKGLVTYLEVPTQRNPYRFYAPPKDAAPALTDAQFHATRAIGAHISAQDAKAFLIHGVTGSGKTEIYLDLVSRALAIGKSALVLIPEIGLTAQLLDLFKARFDDERVAVLHSALSFGERHDEWRRIKSGTARVVLGPRSAVFSPVDNLGLIIMDEEHDGSFKQDTNPRYHARDVARKRSLMSGAIFTMGSATPSVESFYAAEAGLYELISLPERIDNRPLPPVEIVDLREEFSLAARRKEAPPGGETPPRSVFGKRLASAIAERLDRSEQTILFLNRRGFATFLLCRDCGHTPHCPNCSVSVTYHHAIRMLQCHHCDFHRRAPDTCPACGSARLRPFGLGTEKVEEAVALNFPTARTLRMDRDTLNRKGAHADALRLFRRGDADILIGTQIVAKGLDFPNVTLVGVINADTALNIPDFRASERAFQLMTQVAGRAGRGKRPGEVIVQTFNPEHQSIQRASTHDYLGFYRAEIENRKELRYPPFTHIANLVVADEEERHARARIDHIAQVLRNSIRETNAPAQMSGPASCPLSRLKNRYRWHLLLRAEKRSALMKILEHSLDQVNSSGRASVSIDIDPMTML